MFVAQRADRARRVRRAFVALCLLPTLVLAGIAAWRYSPLHRESFNGQASSLLGVDASVGRLRHLRPGVMALERLTLADASRHATLSFPQAVLEVTAREVRLRGAAVEITPSAAAMLVRLARSWLLEPRRFGRDVVIEVAGVAPAGPHPETAVTSAAPRSLRVECVAATNGRAIRLRAGADDEDGLLVQSFVASADEPARFEISGSWASDLPVGMMASCLEWPALPTLVGPAATISGRFAVTASDTASRGSFSGVIDGIDLAACVAGLPLVAEGRLRVDVERAVIDAGRIVEASVRVSGGPGVVGRGTLDAVAAALGGRVLAPPVLPPEARVSYDTLSLHAVIDEDGVTFGGPAGGAGIVAGGRGLLDLPAGPLPVGRLAWALSPATAPTVPATRQSAWLLSVLPLPRAAAQPPSAAGPMR